MASTAHAIACFGLVSVLLLQTQAQTQQPLTIRVANQAMERWPDGRLDPQGTTAVWGFELGIVLCGMDAVWRASREPAYFRYVQHSVDELVQPDGTIETYNPQAYSLNNILIGRELLMLYQATHQEKYHVAAKTLRQQIGAQPRTLSGGVWHAQATPNLMLLDDQFMLAPFYAEYAAIFHEPHDLDDVVKQFTLLEQHSRNASTGLMYHGWDESRSMPWANKSTGTSASLWARGMGWYLMALTDTLPYCRPCCSGLVRRSCKRRTHAPDCGIRSSIGRRERRETILSLPRCLCLPMPLPKVRGWEIYLRPTASLQDAHGRLFRYVLSAPRERE
jgi:hypothetical protein